jgi:hypothetical protein
VFSFGEVKLLILIGVTEAQLNNYFCNKALLSAKPNLMIKNNLVRNSAIFLMAIVTLSFSSDLEYKDVLDGKLKMLIPADFIHVPKGSYKLHYIGDKAPDEFYCNRDTSEYLALEQLPKITVNFSHVKELVQLVWSYPTNNSDTTNNKVHFNDTTTINGNKIYLLETDGMDSGKFRATKTFIMNTHDSAVLGVISCDIGLKQAWAPISDRMLKSIKLN